MWALNKVLLCVTLCHFGVEKSFLSSFSQPPLLNQTMLKQCTTQAAHELNIILPDDMSMESRNEELRELLFDVLWLLVALKFA